MIEVNSGGQSSGTHLENQGFELVDHNAMDMDIQEVNDMPTEFTATLYSSNVDKSSHGVVKYDISIFLLIKFLKIFLHFSSF